MKRLLIITALLVVSCGESATLETSETSDLKWKIKPLRVATYNIQCISPEPARAAWLNRLPAVLQVIDRYDFDLVAVQEPFMTQIEDMMQSLALEYEYVGACVTGDDTCKDEPFNLFFYKKTRLECLEYDVIWFTPEPGRPGYQAETPRMCIWGKFQDRNTGKTFCCFNCHFDHQSSFSRARSAEIVVESVRKISPELPCIVAGDFNAKQGAQAYGYLMDSGLFADALYAVDTPLNAEYESYNKYKPLDDVPESGLHLDHIFYTPTNSKAISWRMITDMPDGQWGSDHFPICVEWYPGHIW